MAKNFTSLQVKVLELFLPRYMQKVTENYLSKVTRYFYFVTSQHCISHWHLHIGKLYILKPCENKFRRKLVLILQVQHNVLF